MATLERAISIAVQAHKGQKDKAGSPYILHPLRLMLRMNSDIEMIAAALHDVVEDTNWTLRDLKTERFSDEVLNAIDCLTHREHETYEHFIKRLKTNPVARRVKLADLEHNMDMRRLHQLGDKDVERFRKYHAMWLILMAERESIPKK